MSSSTTQSKAFRVQRISLFHYTPLIIESKPKRNTAIRGCEDDSVSDESHAFIVW